jgi:hypothetical protein
MPLVAWDTIWRGRHEGGLGVISFHSQAQVFKLRYVFKLMDDHFSEWITMGKEQ